MEVMLSVY